MNAPSLRSLTPAKLVPPLAALALVILFTALGFWQLERADEKRALQAAFESGSEPLTVQPGIAPAPFAPLAASGHYLAGRQILIDNIVMDGRLGFYVITPLALEGGGPLLLVNRGWVPKHGDTLPDLSIGEETRTVTGRAGTLPRVGVRPGEAFADDGGWPRRATFPTSAEVAEALGREVLPFVLLADPAPESGMLRRWEPPAVGPGRHLAYAFQWFALAVAVAVVAVVVWRRGRAGR